MDEKIIRIKEMISILTALDGCEYGGIITPIIIGGNISDQDIEKCLNYSYSCTDIKEYGLSIFICEELLKINMEDRLKVISNKKGE